MESIIRLQACQLQNVKKELKKLNEKLELVQNTLKHHKELHEQQILIQTEIAREFRQQFQNITKQLSYFIEPTKASVEQVLDEKPGELSLKTKTGQTSCHPSGTSSELAEPSVVLPKISSLDDCTDDIELNLQDPLWEWYPTDEHLETNNDDWLEVGPKGRSRKNYSQNNSKENGTEHSTVATGAFADIISQMMSHDESLSQQSYEQINFLPGRQSRGNHDSRSRVSNARRRKKDTTSGTPKGDSMFYISDLHSFQIPNTPACTHDFYTSPNSCKVSLKFLFNNRHRLEVYLLVSEGTFDKQHKWPVVFDGVGYIFNESSQTYTQLWTIESQECPMPASDQELPIKASVCLATSRDPRKAVTLDLLRKKHYVPDDDGLVLTWSLRSTEKAAVPDC